MTVCTWALFKQVALSQAHLLVLFSLLFAVSLSTAIVSLSLFAIASLSMLAISLCVYLSLPFLYLFSAIFSFFSALSFPLFISAFFSSSLSCLLFSLFIIYFCCHSFLQSLILSLSSFFLFPVRRFRRSYLPWKSRTVQPWVRRCWWVLPWRPGYEDPRL